MHRLRSLAVLSVRRMAANRRLLACVALGALVSSAILSTTAIYADAIRDLGLKHALTAGPAGTTAVLVTRDAPTGRADAYHQSSEREDRTLRSALGNAMRRAIRQGTSQTLYLTAPG